MHGRRIASCLSLAVTHEGDEVTTIEGLAQEGRLHSVQQAFLENDSFQCGSGTDSGTACVSSYKAFKIGNIGNFMLAHLKIGITYQTSK